MYHPVRGSPPAVLVALVVLCSSKKGLASCLPPSPRSSSGLFLRKALGVTHPGVRCAGPIWQDALEDTGRTCGRCGDSKRKAHRILPALCVWHWAYNCKSDPCRHGVQKDPQSSHHQKPMFSAGMLTGRHNALSLTYQLCSTSAAAVNMLLAYVHRMCSSTPGSHSFGASLKVDDLYAGH